MVELFVTLNNNNNGKKNHRFTFWSDSELVQPIFFYYIATDIVIADLCSAFQHLNDTFQSEYLNYNWTLLFTFILTF